MGDVIPVDFATMRARKEAQVAMAEANKAIKQAPAVTVNLSQAAMLRLCELQMSEEQFTELSAAIHDYDCYMESCGQTQLLVDIYQMLEAF
jgi:hypothetical protein